MGKRRLEQCRSGKDFLKYAERGGAEIRTGKGSHHIVRTDRGMCVIPAHASDLGKGILSKIMKTFCAIGLGVFLLLWFGII